ncbi:MAG: hypothetical protein FJX70_02090 [Alphaproteobacteria bacterium]|jgi:glutaredoxin 3|nr:hypothetical protein [Alphaproteobacteria bacterium]
MKITDILQNKGLIVLTTILAVYIIFKLMVISKNPQLIEQLPDRENMQVIVYVKEGCIYCMMAKDLLVENKIIYETIELASNPALQKKLIEKTRQTTVPYIFINNKFIGGYNDLLKLKKENKL